MEPQASAVTWTVEGRTYFGGHGEGGWRMGRDGGWTRRGRQDRSMRVVVYRGRGMGMSRGMNWEGGG